MHSKFGGYNRITTPLTYNASCSAHLGRKSEAQAAIGTLLQLIPRFNLSAVIRRPMFERAEAVERMVEGLKLAGFPES